MNMIDVLKRLAELDAANPRISKVSEDKVDECGMAGMGEMHPPMNPSTPASINMTAGSADELGNLLKDIVSLAGMNPEQDIDSPVDDPVGTLEPIGQTQSDPVDSMRSVIDKLNPDDSEEEPEADDSEEVDEYDNTPSDPTSLNPFDSNKFSNKENQPGQGDRMDGNMPKGIPTMEEVEQQLFTEYKKFIQEN